MKKIRQKQTQVKAKHILHLVEQVTEITANAEALESIGDLSASKLSAMTNKELDKLTVDLTLVLNSHKGKVVLSKIQEEETPNADESSEARYATSSWGFFVIFAFYFCYEFHLFVGKRRRRMLAVAASACKTFRPCARLLVSPSLFFFYFISLSSCRSLTISPRRRSSIMSP